MYEYIIKTKTLYRSDQFLGYLIYVKLSKNNIRNSCKSVWYMREERNEKQNSETYWNKSKTIDTFTYTKGYEGLLTKLSNFFYFIVVKIVQTNLLKWVPTKWIRKENEKIHKNN